MSSRASSSSAAPDKNSPQTVRLGGRPRSKTMTSRPVFASRIAAAAPAHLRPGGWVLLEHGWDQAEAVRGLLAAAGLAEANSRKDLAGIARCSGARRLELG